jgi:regulator of PEP synthase PpsR (kinase-PPPase family)
MADPMHADGSAGDQARPAGRAAPIYVLSGGAGASAEQLVHTALAQFPDCDVPVVTIRHVRQPEEIESAIETARAAGGTLVHTLVDAHLRSFTLYLARERGVPAIDLMGSLLDRLGEVLGREPLGHPGRYRRLHQAYFDRVAAIEYALAHDDGQHPAGWPHADIMLVGVSRTGKTPLSVYLSVAGWKVANLPLVLDPPAPPALFELDRRCVVGLTIEPGQLLAFRQQRYQRLGVATPMEYTDPVKIRAELEAALKTFRRGGFAVVDVTDKAIEMSAEQILQVIGRAR